MRTYIEEKSILIDSFQYDDCCKNKWLKIKFLVRSDSNHMKRNNMVKIEYYWVSTNLISNQSNSHMGEIYYSYYHMKKLNKKRKKKFFVPTHEWCVHI